MKKMKGKRGSVGIENLYQYVMIIVMVGLLLGVGMLVLNSFATASGVENTTAATAINDTMTALSTISNTWLGIIVVIAATAIILGLVINSFAQR